MRHTNKLFSISLLLFATLIWSGAAVAQDAATSVPAVSSKYNQAEILMIVIALLLAFVIWGMGQVLVTLSKQAMTNKKVSNTLLQIMLVAGCMGMSQVGIAQDTEPVAAVKTIVNYGGMNSTAFWVLAAVILFEVVVIGFVLFSIRRIQSELMPDQPRRISLPYKEWWKALDKKLFTKAVAVEQEADILLDHDYDGIRELDNSLPPWWTYGFILTVVIAVVYMLHFHVLGSGKNPTEEYQEELAQARVAIELYESKNADKIDESNLQMPQQAGLDAGKQIYTTLCWTCHGKAGEGGAGPNLTDDYWLHKGSLKDIYLSIKHGYPEKGMQAWEKNYSPREINNIAGYIKTMKGTNPPNARPAQGEMYVETITDSSLVKADTK